MTILTAPWSAEQVALLREFHAGKNIPVCCPMPHAAPRDARLRPTTYGWRCDVCGYQRNWTDDALLRMAIEARRTAGIQHMGASA